MAELRSVPGGSECRAGPEALDKFCFVCLFCITAKPRAGVGKLLSMCRCERCARLHCVHYAQRRAGDRQLEGNTVSCRKPFAPVKERISRMSTQRLPSIHAGASPLPSSWPWPGGAAAPSVLEVAHAGGDQHNAILVAALHRVRVPHAAAGVRDGRDARLAGELHRVVPREGEECVARQRRTLQACRICARGFVTHRGRDSAGGALQEATLRTLRF